MANIGVVLFFISLLMIIIGIILFVISIWIEDLRKPTRYIILASGIMMLVSFSLCSYGG